MSISRMPTTAPAFTVDQLNALLAASTGDTIDFGNNNVLTFGGITNVNVQLQASDFQLTH